MTHPSKPIPQAAQVLALAAKQGILRAREARAAGIGASALARMVVAGQLEHAGRGLYRLAGAPVDENASLAEVAKRIPKGVIALVSALAFHQIGTQLPAEVWVLLPHDTRTPRLDWPKIRVTRTRSATAFADGVDTHHLGGATAGPGVAVKITSPARTVADCFKHRRQVGLDVCLEALRDCVRRRKAAPAELLRYARGNRVEKIMRTYLEALV